MSINTENKKTAVILFNLGGPDSLSAVKPFLFNLFYDPAIIKLPNPFRWLVAKILSTLRDKKAQNIYSLIGGKSSLLEETHSQKKAIDDRLSKIFNGEFKSFICMRHWHPRAKDILFEIEKFKPSEIILLPLYPQFSTTTTGSSISEFQKLLRNYAGLKDAQVKSICCYYNDEKFIDSHLFFLEKTIEELPSLENFRILFSAHSLPKKIIDEGDPYRWQVEQMIALIVKKLAINNLDYKITFQSRATPVEWLKPDTEEEIKSAIDQKKSLIIVPVAFVSEHVETMVELDIEYKALADKGKIQYIRIPTLGINNIFIESLTNMIMNFSSEGKKISNCKGVRTCPQNFKYCPCDL